MPSRMLDDMWNSKVLTNASARLAFPSLEACLASAVCGIQGRRGGEAEKVDSDDKCEDSTWDRQGRSEGLPYSTGA